MLKLHLRLLSFLLGMIEYILVSSFLIWWKFFYDVIYNPNETNFLKIGKELGNKTLNGKLMFVYQALSAFKIWHGVEPDINKEVIKLLDRWSELEL